jgi:pentatricopeptide repeat protein
MESKYCKWFCIRWEDNNKWLFKSRCGESRIVSRGEKFYKQMHNGGICPNCGKPMTVGKLMD